MTGTADRIIAATNELFRRYGYNGTSLSQISDASEATIGSIYHFFPGGKEALAVAVIDSTGRAYRELFETIAAEADDHPSALSDVFAGAAAVLTETDYIDPCPIGTLARETANTSEPLRAAADRAFASWIAAVAQHATEAGAPPDQAERLATTAVATLEGCFILSRTKRDPAPLLTAGPLMAELARAAISTGASR
jgi:AcrR family transcriptional regulator